MAACTLSTEFFTALPPRPSRGGLLSGKRPRIRRLFWASATQRIGSANTRDRVSRGAVGSQLRCPEFVPTRLHSLRQHCAKSHRVANTLPLVLGGETAKKAKLIKP